MRWLIAPLVIAAGLVLVTVGLVVGMSMYVRHRCRAVGLGKPDWLWRDDERSREPVRGDMFLWRQELNRKEAEDS